MKLLNQAALPEQPKNPHRLDDALPSPIPAYICAQDVRTASRGGKTQESKITANLLTTEPLLSKPFYSY